MSDFQDQVVLNTLRQLPGTDEQHTDTRRGWALWEPGVYKEGELHIRHASWDAFRGELANTPFTVFSFRFKLTRPETQCPDCDGSGHTKEMAELDRGFYPHGGGRWAGWGKGRLTEDEVEALASHNRLWGTKGITVTPDNVHRFLGPGGHDAINRHILVEARAKRMGFFRLCDSLFIVPKLKTGRDGIEMLLWTIDPCEGRDRFEVITQISPAEIPDIQNHLREIGLEPMRRRFAWATGSNEHPQPRLVAPEGWRPGTGGLRKMSGLGWSAGETYGDWAGYIAAFGNADTTMNLVADWHFVPRVEDLPNLALVDRGDHQTLEDGIMPEAFGLNVWMAHPRKETTRAIRVRHCTRDDLAAIRVHLARQAQVHEQHFGWVSGRYPNEGG